METLRTTASTKPLLAPAAERAFLAKIAKAELSGEVRAAIDKIVGEGPARDAFLWDLAVRGKLPLHNPAVAARFNAAAPSVEALVRAWSHVDARKCRDVKQQWKGSPTWLAVAASQAIEKDPAPWRAQVEKLAEPLRSVVWIELASGKGDKVPPARRAAITKHIVDSAFGENMQFFVENLESLGHSREQIVRLLFPKAKKRELYQLGRLAEIAPVDDLVKLLLAQKARQFATGALRKILEKRTDTVDDLVKMGTLFAKADKSEGMQFWLHAIAEVALGRCTKTPPKELDAFLTFRYDELDGMSAHVGTMPAARLLARVKRVLAEGDDSTYVRAVPALRWCFDARVYAEVLERVARDLMTLGRPASAIGRVGAAAIPALTRALEEWRKPLPNDQELRDTYIVIPTYDPIGGRIACLRKALLVAHMVAAEERGEQPAAELFMPFPEALFELTWYFLWEEWVHGMAKLPPTTRAEVIAAWRATKTTKWIRKNVIELAVERLDSHLEDLAEDERRAADAAARAN